MAFSGRRKTAYIGARTGGHYPQRLFLHALALLAAVVFGAGAGPPEAEMRIVMLGDSLAAGYGLPPGQGLAAQLDAALRKTDPAARVIDAGVSGDTAAGGRARLDWALADGADAVIVELGANDALRGLAPAETEANLAAILDVLQARGLPVLLAGMKAPRNFGPDYAARFDALYPRLARRPGVLFYPFILDGVAADLTLNQADGLHPTAEGVSRIVARLLPSVRALAAEARKARPAP